MICLYVKVNDYYNCQFNLTGTIRNVYIITGRY